MASLKKGTEKKPNPPSAERSAWEKFKEQLLKPKQLSKKEILERQKLRERKNIAKHILLRRSLLKAGVQASPEIFSRWVFRVSVIINSLVAIYLTINLSHFFQFGGFFLFFLVILLWFGIFLFVLFLLWLALYVALDLLIYKRRVGIEDVLPDFLLLASANIRAGLPIDKALWYAVRPRFGVLANEIELVAKETMSGENLDVALRRFADKYDSSLLTNAISLIVESLEAGGEVGGLLNKISVNLQETKLLKKEMAAGVSAYALFIAVAAIIIAPMLFALSSQLFYVITKITGSIKLPDVSIPLFILKPGGVSLKQSDFFIFILVNLFFTSLFSAMIVTTIRKGEIKAGIKYIPIFIGVSMAVFFLTHKLFSSIFGSIF